MAEFCHEICSNGKERPIRGINMDEFHPRHFRKKKPYIKVYDSVYIKFKMYANLIWGAGSQDSGYL